MAPRRRAPLCQPSSRSTRRPKSRWRDQRHPSSRLSRQVPPAGAAESHQCPRDCSRLHAPPRGGCQSWGDGLGLVDRFHSVYSFKRDVIVNVQAIQSCELRIARRSPQALRDSCSPSAAPVESASVHLPLRQVLRIACVSDRDKRTTAIKRRCRGTARAQKTPLRSARCPLRRFARDGPGSASHQPQWRPLQQPPARAPRPAHRRRP